MALYEHVFLARQDVSNTQVEALTKEYSDIIEQGGGKVTKSEYWGVKSLAYKIKKNRKAHFSLLNIDAPPAAVAEMERRMGISTEIIRFLTVKVGAARDRAVGDDAQERPRRARRPWRSRLRRSAAAREVAVAASAAIAMAAAAVEVSVATAMAVRGAWRRARRLDLPRAASA